MRVPGKGTKKEGILGSPGPKGITIVSAIALIVVAIGILSPTPKPKREEVTAQNERLRSKRAADVAKADRDRSLCRTALICRHFSEARQSCAVAGDFNNCIRVKVGEKDMDRTASCAADGSLADPPADMPNRIRCAVFDLGG
jgi:hypothetical protein